MCAEASAAVSHTLIPVVATRTQPSPRPGAWSVRFLEAFPGSDRMLKNAGGIITKSGARRGEQGVSSASLSDADVRISTLPPRRAAVAAAFVMFSRTLPSLFPHTRTHLHSAYCFFAPFFARHTHTRRPIFQRRRT